MRRLAFAITLLLLGAEVARAGLYNPAERGEGKLNSDFAVFQNTLFSLRSIRLDKVLNDPLQMRYIMMQQTAPRVIPADWNLAQRLSLSAYLIRRERFQEAIELLKPLSRKESDNFLVHSNLSTAYYLSGQEATLAYDALDQALSIWPDNWNKLDDNDKRKQFLGQIGWDEIKFRNYREAETYQLKLLKLRRQEKPKIQPETLDNLFGVNFVGESGSYEAGKLAAKEKAKLPVRALTIVQQLLVWSPHDPRLFWLLGEIYNAQGDVATALKIFKSPELTGEDVVVFPAVPGFRVGMLVDHVRILKTFPVPEANTQEPEKKPPPDGNATNPNVFDVRTLLIGVFAGIILSIFAYWQFREIRRRRAMQK
jgi:tetratricopeptide (TPR) repeat protein